MISCCKDCKPPKRTPYCHATCPEYQQQAQEHQRLMEQVHKERQLGWDVYSQQKKALEKVFGKGKPKCHYCG